MIYQRFTYMIGVVYWITREPSQHCTCILAFDLIILVFENSLSLFQSRSDTLGLYRDICLIHTVPFPYSKLAWPLGMRANDRLHLVMRGAHMLILFDLESISITVTGIRLNCNYLSYVDAYAESLILLNSSPSFELHILGFYAHL